MKDEQARCLLDRIGMLRDRCDLDLLLFFVRHPRVLLSSDQIAARLGYTVKQLDDSIEALVTANLLSRTQKPRGIAQLYVFADSNAPDWLSSLVELASTREGQLAIRTALAHRRKGARRSPRTSQAQVSHPKRTERQ